MNKDRIDGPGKKVAGSAKEAAGKVTGSTRLKVEGKAEKAAGAVQNKVGKMEDRMR